MTYLVYTVRAAYVQGPSVNVFHAAGIPHVITMI